MDICFVGRYLISVLKAVIYGEKTPPKPAEITWEDVFLFALHHKVANILAYAIQGYEGGVPPLVLEKIKKELHLTVNQEAKQEYEARRIFQAFDRAQIAYMPLKGYIMKHFYPSPDMRTMSDIDVLIKKKDAEKAADIMNSLGYARRFSNNEEDAYLKPPMSSFELHKQMVGVSHKLYHDYYGNGWGFAKVQDGFHYFMTDEDYYIYHIVHLTKHYKERGTGIRSLLDIQVYLDVKEQEMDWEYIQDELAKLGLDRFAQNLRGVAGMWFGNDVKTQALSQMEVFIFESGVYGKLDNFYARQNTESKIKRLLHLAFPPAKVMTGLYPVLKKAPTLTPVFWVYRIICKLCIKHSRLAELSAAPSLAEKQRAEALERHFTDVGL